MKTVCPASFILSFFLSSFLSYNMSRVYTPFLADRPVSEPRTIAYIMATMGGRIDLHPVYQRGISWSQENMCDLVKTIMHNGLIPGLLLYKLQADDEKAEPTFKHECVDGQHRLFTLYHFLHGLPVQIPGKTKDFMISLRYEQDDHIVHVFYAENEHTRKWFAETKLPHAYMTEEEQDHFNEFCLDVREIKNKLTLDQRRKIFVSLQKGVPVRGSDLYKNKVDIPLVKFLSEEKRLEEPAKGILRQHLQQKPEKFWLHWLIRLFLIQTADKENRVEAFLTKDSDITAMMKKNDPVFNTTSEQNDALAASVARFFAYLASLPAGTRVSHTLFFALFTTLLDMTDDAAAIVASHMRSMSEEGTAKQRKTWENRSSPEERQEYFEHIVAQIACINTPAPEPGTRTEIPKKIRLAVWNRDCGDSDVGVCDCCKEAVSYDAWECSHVIADKCGGKPVLGNLRVCCRSCNRSMGTENLETYKARFYGSGGLKA
jgi:5-methylcytosine-specific restriction endonuclease McrA